METKITLHNGRYLVINEVGRGSEGIVYLCEDTIENYELYFNFIILIVNILPLNIRIK
jgi:hypothetical protein